MNLKTNARSSSDPFVILGIDPGKTGALAWITIVQGAVRSLQYARMPQHAEGIDVRALLELLTQKRADFCHVEQVGNFAGHKEFDFGVSVGKLHACLELATFRYELVLPKLWQTSLDVTTRFWVRDKAVKSRTDRQRRNLAGCQQLIADFPFFKVDRDSDGVIAATGIALAAGIAIGRINAAHGLVGVG